jgi:septum formation protein
MVGPHSTDARIILASASPRRQQLLTQAGVVFEVIESCIDENIKGTAKERVEILAVRKAEAVAVKLLGERALANTNTVIIAADTLVSIDGQVLEKPKDAAEAFVMLKTLQGRKHTVFTGVAIIKSNNTQSFVEEADVFFRPLTEKEIKAYINTGEPFDKAGAYGIQGKGALLTKRINGDFYTVMGLPLSRLCVELSKMGIDLL